MYYMYIKYIIRYIYLCITCVVIILSDIFIYVLYTYIVVAQKRFWATIVNIVSDIFIYVLYVVTVAYPKHALDDI